MLSRRWRLTESDYETDLRSKSLNRGDTPVGESKSWQKQAQAYLGEVRGFNGRQGLPAHTIQAG